VTAITLQRLAEIKALAEAATAGPWRAMRNGNQYLHVGEGEHGNKLVGASRIVELERPWNPYAGRKDDPEVVRLPDADADLIAALSPDTILAILREIEAGRALRDLAATACAIVDSHIGCEPVDHDDVVELGVFVEQMKMTIVAYDAALAGPGGGA